MDPILQVDRLSISFTQYERGLRQRTLPVIRDLSLSLFPGQVTAAVGSSGSGKSLLAHGILGLLPYNSRMEGTILYRGEPLTQRRAEALRGREIVLIPQGVTYLDPLMKVGPQVRKGRRDAAGAFIGNTMGRGKSIHVPRKNFPAVRVVAQLRRLGNPTE